MPVGCTPEAAILLIELVLASLIQAVLMFLARDLQIGGGKLKRFRSLLASYGLPCTGPCFTSGQLAIGCDKCQSRSEAKGSAEEDHIGLEKVVNVDMW